LTYQSYHNANFHIYTDPAQQDVDAIHAFLFRAYWCEGIPRETVARSIQNSLCFGVFDGERQVGLTRVITDRATYGYICDVYILEEYRGRGLSKWLMSCIMAHPDLQNLRRWTLATRDAHGLYAQFGFVPIKQPERWMEIRNSDAYRKQEFAQ
jgi:GNAT superfamily N-acetyltransferase